MEHSLRTITLLPGEKWSGMIGKNKSVALTVLGQEANLSTLIYLKDDLAERYNMPDTLKAQHTAHLTTGHLLMSDNGRALVSIIEDTVGWHDPFGGYSTRLATDAKFGHTTYQQLRNGWFRSAEENFKVELLRNNLSNKDLCPPINFFSKVVCNEEGQLTYVNPLPKVESKNDNHRIVLRTELDTLFIFSNTPHPLNPNTTYTEATIQIDIIDIAPAATEDICYLHCGENKRAFENSWRYLSLI